VSATIFAPPTGERAPWTRASARVAERTPIPVSAGVPEAPRARRPRPVAGTLDPRFTHGRRGRWGGMGSDLNCRQAPHPGARPSARATPAPPARSPRPPAGPAL